ncbi:hypothetical protein BC830DRAFT_790131 [Chytriomyces sp. MP71]|nr:hypothetical protein BC830DRAFT_790131 [Chytriomyces sp. MP71]
MTKSAHFTDVWRSVEFKLFRKQVSIKIPWFFTLRTSLLAFLLIIFSLLLNVRIFDAVEQRNCFAILVLISGLWAFEILPLFVTSTLVPFLIVVLRVIVLPVNMPDGTTKRIRLPAEEQAVAAFKNMFSPVIMLLLGGTSLASAWQKHGLASRLARNLLIRAGERPERIILATMFVSTFASMWISNVAAPVLCYSLLQPLLDTLPRGSTYAKSLIIGVALAANVGGMASPISSPQNIIAMDYMSPAASWMQWLAVSIPLCIVLDLAIWGVILLVYKPQQFGNSDIERPASIKQGDCLRVNYQSLSSGSTSPSRIDSPPGQPDLLSPFGVSQLGSDSPLIRSSSTSPSRPFSPSNSSHSAFIVDEAPINGTQLYIVLLTLFTISLWCSGNKLDDYLGDMGVIAILPVVALYGPGVLTKEDWNGQMWNVVMLAMGGICLGTAVETSGLLATLVSTISPALIKLSAYNAAVVLSVIVFIVTTVVSSSAGALVMMPLIAKIGASLAGGQPRLLVMVTVLTCSASMGLPVSSFPNMMASAKEDNNGYTYLTCWDFYKVGIPSSIVAWGFIITMGYGIAIGVGLK